MRLAIFSDIHGNLEAFETVCADIERRRVDGTVCLGDMVGYGPDPDDVVQRVRQMRAATVLGNHEAALGSARVRSRMNFQARENSIETETLLSPENLEYCRNLPSSLDIGTASFVHGFPPDSVFLYLYSQPDEKIRELLAAPGPRLFFVGHTHGLQLVTCADDDIVRLPLGEGVHNLEQRKRYIVNVGSVGQPRDRDNRAKYLIWDDETDALEVCCLAYDNAKTMAKILRRGFPGIYAERLR